MLNNQNKSEQRPLVPEERRRQIEQLIRETGSLTVALLEEEFGISPMTARRDLAVLEQGGRLRRTHGGAILPGFAGHEDSFQHRLEEKTVEKQSLAQAAVKLVEPGETVFLDSSTTAYYAAREILAAGTNITLLTNSVPVMDLFTSGNAANADLVGTGGTLRKLTLSFVGPHAVRTISSHFADKAFLSVKGVAPEGYLTDPDPLEAEVKRAMIEQSEEPVLLADGSKFETRGFSVIAPVSDLALVLAAGANEAQTKTLETVGVEVRIV